MTLFATTHRPTESSPLPVFPHPPPSPRAGEAVPWVPGHGCHGTSGPRRLRRPPPPGHPDRGPTAPYYISHAHTHQDSLGKRSTERPSKNPMPELSAQETFSCTRCWESLSQPSQYASHSCRSLTLPVLVPPRTPPVLQPSPHRPPHRWWPPPPPPTPLSRTPLRPPKQPTPRAPRVPCPIPPSPHARIHSSFLLLFGKSPSHSGRGPQHDRRRLCTPTH